MFLDLLSSDGNKSAMIHIDAYRYFWQGDQTGPLLPMLLVFVDGIHQNNAIVMQFSFGTYFLKSGNIYFIHKKKVQRVFVKLNIGKGLPYQFFYLRVIFDADLFKAEIINRLEQYIGAFVLVKLFLGIEA